MNYSQAFDQATTAHLLIMAPISEEALIVAARHLAVAAVVEGEGVAYHFEDNSTIYHEEPGITAT